jgi:hypothetical protein
MVSTLKSETARINGAKSRGPTTAEGKEKSSHNAIKHGLTSGNGNILLDSEDPHQFDEILNKLLGIHAPATPAEQDLVEEMVAARWRTRRMWTIETGLLNAEILNQAAKTDNPDPKIHLASAFHALADDSRSLALASRYEARLQRLYDRAYKTLRELQQAHKSEPPEHPHNIQIRWVTPDNPSVSEGASQPADPPCQPDPPAPETELPNERGWPRISATPGNENAPLQPNSGFNRLRVFTEEPSAAEPVPQAFLPVFRTAKSSPPETNLRNEPTAPATKEVTTDPSADEPACSSIQHPPSTNPPSLN